jgi:hypothetical protein
MVLRCSFASSLGAEPKKDGSRRDWIAEKKSGGVTSETNHGMSLGLTGINDVIGVGFSIGFLSLTYWKTTFETYGVYVTRKSARTRSVKS